MIDKKVYDYNIESSEFKGFLDGIASYTRRLIKSVTMIFTGDVSGSVEFDGSRNRSMHITCNHSVHSKDSTTSNKSYKSEDAKAICNLPIEDIAIDYTKDKQSIYCLNTYCSFDCCGYVDLYITSDSISYITIKQNDIELTIDDNDTIKYTHYICIPVSVGTTIKVTADECEAYFRRAISKEENSNG